jgi:hypothetical protein
MREVILYYDSTLNNLISTAIFYLGCLHVCSLILKGTSKFITVGVAEFVKALIEAWSKSMTLWHSWPRH